MSLIKNPNPGSPMAFEMGCTCPGRENSYGSLRSIELNSDGEPCWVIETSCPLHSPYVEEDRDGA